jgi:hypothetical protein
MADASRRVSRLRPTSRRAAASVDWLRALCLSFPDATERRSHGEPTWFAGKGKAFAMLDDHHHGAPHLAVWLPQPLGTQEALVAGEPARFFRPPYVGAAGWVGVVLDGQTDWERVASLLREAYLHVAGARLKARLLQRSPRPGEAAARRTSAP